MQADTDYLQYRLRGRNIIKSTATPFTNMTLQPPTLPVRHFIVDEYHRMIQSGVLTDDDAVELLEGWIVPKKPRNPPHGCAIELAVEVADSTLARDRGEKGRLYARRDCPLLDH